MKKFLAISLVTVWLGGCATGPTSTQIDQTVAQVQAIAQQVCAFVPTAQTVLNIISALGVPGVGIAGDIASKICTAVTSKSARRGAAAPKLYGVTIRGNFVR